MAGLSGSRISVLKRLKQETSAQHASLENELDLLRPGITGTSYCDLLNRFHTIYSSWEPLAATLVSPEFPSWPAERTRLKLLRADLAHFGRSSASPQAVAFPGIDTLATALGGMYVLEGSTLGSQILVKHFGQCLGVTPETGAAFFHGYGARTGAIWRSFTDALEGYSLRSGEEDETVRGARIMFEVVHRELCGGRE